MRIIVRFNDVSIPVGTGVVDAHTISKVKELIHQMLLIEVIISIVKMVAVPDLNLILTFRDSTISRKGIPVLTFSWVKDSEHVCRPCIVGQVVRTSSISTITRETRIAPNGSVEGFGKPLVVFRIEILDRNSVLSVDFSSKEPREPQIVFIKEGLVMKRIGSVFPTAESS